MNDLVQQDTVLDIKKGKAIKLVQDAVDSPATKRAYARGVSDFLDWWEYRGKPGISRALVHDYKDELVNAGLGAVNINQRLSSIRKLASEIENNLQLDALASATLRGVQSVKGVKQSGERAGNWLTLKEAQALLRAPDISTLKGLRDRAVLAVFVGCGLRRNEAAELTFDNIQQREARWVIVDLVGKGGKLRTIPMPSWVKQAIDEWANAAEINSGRVFRAMAKGDKLAGDSISPKALRDIVVMYAPDNVAPHDLRRTHAKLAYQGGADLDQIQLVLGHASIATTERYLGVTLDLHNAPGDHIKIGL